jgi:hypothetical protein
VHSGVDHAQIPERPNVAGLGLEYRPESSLGPGVVLVRQRRGGFFKYNLRLIRAVKQAKTDQAKTKS